jgi:hypothetical protein
MCTDHGEKKRKRKRKKKKKKTQIFQTYDTSQNTPRLGTDLTFASCKQDFAKIQRDKD